MFKYAIEASVIIVGILLSFYIEEVRTVNKNIEIKNELLGDLNRAIERDLEQINKLRKVRAIKRAEDIEHKKFVSVMYQAPTDAGAGGGLI